MENLTLASSRASAVALDAAGSLLTEWAATAAAQAPDAAALKGTLEPGIVRGLEVLSRTVASVGNAGPTALLARVFDHVASAAGRAAGQLADQPTEVNSAAAAQAVLTALEVARAEVLPVLASAPSVDMDRLLAALSPAADTARRAGATEAAPAAGPTTAAGPATGEGCGCGGHDKQGADRAGVAEDGLAELDTRVIPHAIRHATVFGTLDGLATGRGILLIANHNPLPLLAQLEQRAAGQFEVSYVEKGPETFRLSVVRR